MSSLKDSALEQLKAALQSSSGEHKKAFESELRDIMGSAENVGKNVLIIGGSLLLTYLVYKKFFTSSPEPQKEESKGEADHDAPNPHESPRKGGLALAKSESLFNSMLDEMGVVLLTMARQKLIDFLTQLASEENESVPDPAAKS
jgi:hypothetical protein